MNRGTIAIAACLVIAACSSAPGDGKRTIRATVNGQHVRLDQPRTGNRHALAVWFHGQGGDENTRMNEAWLNTLRDDGWTVASGQLGGGAAWGDPASVRAASDLVSWAQKQSHPTKTVLVGGSMGALSSLDYLRAGGKASCWYGPMPALNLPELAQQKLFHNEIVKDYTTAAAEEQASPALAPGAAFPKIRYRVLASPQDELVSKTANADLFVAHLLAAGRSVTTMPTSGKHGDPSNFNAADLLSFARFC